MPFVFSCHLSEQLLSCGHQTGGETAQPKRGRQTAQPRRERPLQPTRGGDHQTTREGRRPNQDGGQGDLRRDQKRKKEQKKRGKKKRKTKENCVSMIFSLFLFFFFFSFSLFLWRPPTTGRGGRGAKQSFKRVTSSKKFNKFSNYTWGRAKRQVRPL